MQQIEKAIQNKKASKFESLLTCYSKMVREKGLEPSRLAAHAPKACVSTIPPLAHIGRS